VNIRVLRDLEVPLRDGTITSAEAWLPDAPEARPVIVVRTPYLKEAAAPTAVVDTRAAVSRGYGVLLQDVRGRGASGGVFEPFVNEEADGYDTVQWAAAQRWCDGNVVMAGMSYVGATQWLAAAARPPALRAIAPTLSSDDYAEGWSYTAGIPEYGFLTSWCAADLAPEDLRLLDQPESAWSDIDSAVAVAPWLADWLANPPGSQYWFDRSVSHRRADIDVPALIVAGWYDIFLQGSLRAFQRSFDRRDQLIIGPWAHTEALSHLVGAANLGVAGSGDRVFAEWLLDFYDSILSGDEPAGARVRAYVLGRRRWANLDSWPPTEVKSQSIPLTAGKFAVSCADPVPSLGGRGLLAHTADPGFGVVDHGPLIGRDDVHTAMDLGLSVDTLLAGPVTAHLLTGLPESSNDSQQLWVATLCVQGEAGQLDNLVGGVAIAQAGRPCVVELGDTFAWLPAGSRLVLLISGSSYPRWPLPAVDCVQHILDGSELRLTLASTAMLDR
jgi:uncharacterized protein